MAENMEEMEEIIQDFLLEAEELLEELDEDLVKLESSSDNSDLLNKIFRAFHTIKGSASFLGFEKLTHLTHRLEDILNKLRKFEITLNSEMMDTILSSVDKAKSIIEIIKEGADAEAVDIEDNIKALSKFLDENPELSDEELIEAQKEEIEEEEIEQFAEGDLEEDEDEKPKEKKSDEEIEAEIERLLQQRMEEDKRKREEKKKKMATQNQQKEKAKEEKEEEKKDSEIKEEKTKQETANKPKQNTPAAAKKSKPVIEQTIRVDVNRLDDLMNLVGELVLGKNRLVSVAQKAEEKFEGDDVVEELSGVASQITLVTTDLQMGVMKTRMVQVGKVFNKFPRVVRDISKEVNKSVELIIEGAETELDKSVVEEINDPLVHIIRNAIDHGIESAEDRIKAGKPAKGKIVLSAYHEGNYIIIETSDDGKGMDADMLKSKALEKGLITETEARQMSKEEAFGLIFKPGFSTAQQVSNISGRGVGMDVVKTNIEKLNGIIEIKSELGKGSKIVLKIPLTLAIIQALLVKVTKEFFAIPLVSVVETVRIAKNEINKVENKDVLRLRDSIIPLVYLGDALGIGNNKKTIDAKEIYVVVVAVAEKKIGLVVDKLIGREEVVIKSLGNYLTNIKSISGATIMGDGSVTLILDIASVVNESSNISTNIEDHMINKAATAKDKPSCLVVSTNSDVKKTIRGFMQEVGFEVYVAYNNKEALDIASEHIVDVVFTEVDIPISGGYNFAKLIRDFPAYRNVHIVMVSTDGTYDKEKLHESKINDVIFTPISLQDIERVIDSLSKKIKIA
jgi:two-component system chemotaxis sensor kinase CheA